MSASTDQEKNSNKNKKSELSNQTTVFPENKGSGKNKHSGDREEDQRKADSILAEINGPDSK